MGLSLDGMTVIFNGSTLFYRVGVALRPMPHSDEVLGFLANRGTHLVSCFQDGGGAEEVLGKIGLLDFFVQDGQAQIISLTQETGKARELDLQPKTFYQSLKRLGVKSLENVASIVGHFEEVKEARASGVKKIIGFYGSPSVSLGSVQAQKSAMERDVVALAGTRITTANLREVPELIGCHV